MQEELDTYRAQEDEVKHLKSIMVGTKKSLLMQSLQFLHGLVRIECYTSGIALLTFRYFLKGLEAEDDGAISMLSDNTAKLTSAVR